MSRDGDMSLGGVHNAVSGLGLSVVKAVVQAHRGRVEVSLNPSGGSCFTVYLPLNPAV